MEANARAWSDQSSLHSGRAGSTFMAEIDAGFADVCIDLNVALPSTLDRLHQGADVAFRPSLLTGPESQRAFRANLREVNLPAWTCEPSAHGESQPLHINDALAKSFRIDLTRLPKTPYIPDHVAGRAELRRGDLTQFGAFQRWECYSIA